MQASRDRMHIMTTVLPRSRWRRQNSIRSSLSASVHRCTTPTRWTTTTQCTSMSARTTFVVRADPSWPTHYQRWARTSVFGWWTFTVLRSTCSWWVTTIMGKPPATDQSTRPTQPFIILGSINRVPALHVIGWDKGGNVTSAGWQVHCVIRYGTLSSHSSEAFANCYYYYYYYYSLLRHWGSISIYNAADISLCVYFTFTYSMPRKWTADRPWCRRGHRYRVNGQSVGWVGSKIFHYYGALG